MKCELTVSNNNKRLILIFAGWSTDSSFYRNISVEGYDVMVVWDYEELSFDLEIFDRYHTVCLFAWSLGVEAASKVVPFDKLAMAVAINGTEIPVSDTSGIPSEIFKGTASNLSERNLMKFRKRMSGSLFNSLKEKFPTISTEKLSQELSAIYHRQPIERPTIWDRVYVSLSDSIFPPENMKRYWENHSSKPEIVTIEAPHYVDLLSVVNACVPEISTVRNRFRKAVDNYSSHASAQSEIAEHLAGMIDSRKTTSVIEIGPADGLFSRQWAKLLKPEKIVYIDLFPINKFGLAPHEVSVCDDAEEWMAQEAVDHPESYDALLSASTIQWFANPERFFSNVAGVIRPGGLLALSTFLPGNMQELREINPFGLLYRQPQRLREMLEKWFDDIIMETDSITLSFHSGKQTLAHLSQTGVGGSFQLSGGRRISLTEIPHNLTFRPLYIIAKRKMNFINNNNKIKN